MGLVKVYEVLKLATTGSGACRVGYFLNPKCAQKVVEENSSGVRIWIHPKQINEKTIKQGYVTRTSSRPKVMVFESYKAYKNHMEQIEDPKKYEDYNKKAIIAWRVTKVVDTENKLETRDVVSVGYFLNKNLADMVKKEILEKDKNLQENDVEVIDNTITLKDVKNKYVQKTYKDRIAVFEDHSEYCKKCLQLEKSK